MIPDTLLAANPDGPYHNLYAATGIAPGTPLLIQNKGNSNQVLWEGAQPPDAVWDGVVMGVGDEWVADQIGVTGCWVKSGASLTLCVQVYTGD